MNNWFDVVRMIFVLGGAAAAITFPIYYHVTARWWESEMGRQLMLSAVTIGSLYGASLVSIFITNEGVQEAIRAFLIILAFTSSWRQLIVYRKFKKAVLKRQEDAHG